MIRWLLAAVHLLGLGIGLGAIWSRAMALRSALDPAGIRRVLYADTWWGISALLLIGTGLVRAFGPFEKGSTYYLHNHLFFTKLFLLGVILLLELAPMIALIRWRVQLQRGAPPDTSRATLFARLSLTQAVLLVLMVLAATGMARGYGTLTP